VSLFQPLFYSSNSFFLVIMYTKVVNNGAGKEDIEIMAAHAFTSLVVVAPKLEPSALLTSLLPLLQPSASLAVYASSLPPLAECFQKLQATRKFAALHVRFHYDAHLPLVLDSAVWLCLQTTCLRYDIQDNDCSNRVFQ
jgi:hypothetical protein